MLAWNACGDDLVACDKGAVGLTQPRILVSNSSLAAFGFAMHFLRIPRIPVRPMQHFLSSIVVFSCWQQQQEIVSQSGKLQQPL